MHLPRATYRLQFNEGFTLTQALALTPYFHELGVSHIYASPLLQASPHSQHGYDVCQYNRLNPELGTEDDLERLAIALHEKNMGLILDIVPNHMGINSPENFWWWDVLTNGERSRYAGYFDIEWLATDKNLTGKILIPVLGEPYESVLKKGEIKVLRDKRGFVLGYHKHHFPLAPHTIMRLPTDEREAEYFNANLKTLDELINQQHYLLEHHEKGDTRLNYRRFFAVSTLAAVRVEDNQVFQETHALIRKWIENGWIDGLRVDHPDGLRDPQNYLERLREFAPRAWIVVEKILEPAEQLPESWAVSGSTGYDFLNQLNGIFIDAKAEHALTNLYAEFTTETTNYKELVYDKKQLVLETLFVTEQNRLTGLLNTIAVSNSPEWELRQAELSQALAAIIVYFPVYRSYISEPAGTPSPTDTALIKNAVKLVSESRKDIPQDCFAFIQTLLLGPNSSKETRDFVARFQQLTGPVMAKGVEDTAFYCFNRFTSLNEVGGDPSIFGISVEKFHKFLQKHQNSWPHSQLTTSTHDTKRSEDVRARLNVISEIPDLWAQTVRRWSEINECHRSNNFPDRNAEYLYYQTLAGAWPVSVERVQFYMDKAVHEAKLHTSWTKRNAAYEAAVQNFISETLHDPQFTTELESFVRTLAIPAAVNSLSQTLIKLTAPGVPDIYQGCELWDWSLVDPDNRRPVDFPQRQRLLAECESLSAEQIWARRGEGLPKLWIISKTLQLRSSHPDFFQYNYEPFYARGERSEHIVAFQRSGKILTIVPRFLLKLNNNWHETTLPLPPGTWFNEFTRESFTGDVPVKHLFQNFPVALLVRKEED